MRNVSWSVGEFGFRRLEMRSSGRRDARMWKARIELTFRDALAGPLPTPCLGAPDCSIRIAVAKKATEARNLGTLSVCSRPSEDVHCDCHRSDSVATEETGNGFGGGIRPSSFGRGAQAERWKAVAGPRPGFRASSEV